jgi:hypothetical protein
MITHVIVELEHPIEEDWMRDYSDEYYGIGTPLVMCKDCKWWRQNPYRESSIFGLCFKHKDIAIATENTDWCSWAEERRNK